MRPSPQLLFCVGHYVCPAHLGLRPSHQSLTFDRDISLQSFEIIFSILNMHNSKISSEISFHKKDIKIKVFLNGFITQSGPGDIFTLKLVIL